MMVLSVVVHDLHVEGIPFTPLEADSPLIVDPDAVLAAAVASESFQPVAGWHTQIGKTLGVVQHSQLSPRCLLDIPAKSPDHFPSPDTFGVSVPEGSDH
jgi:hypothetical protein